METCPECGAQRTLRRGVCLRCGYRTDVSTPPNPTAMPTPTPDPASATPDPCTPTPVVPIAPPPPPTPMPGTGPSSGPASASTATRGHRRGGSELEGRITTLGTRRTEVVQLAGAKIGASLTGLCGLTVVILLLLKILGALAALALQILILLIIVVVIVLLVLGPAGGGCLVVLSGLWAPLLLMPFKMLLGGTARNAGNNKEIREVEIPVIPFTVTDASGTRTEVVIRGELKGGDVHQGDRIAVEGRRRSGVLDAKLVLNRDTGSQIRPRTHPAVLRSRAFLIGGLVALAMTTVLAISLYAGHRA